MPRHTAAAGLPMATLHAKRVTAAKADECYAKAQYWLDRANLLSGRSDRPAPKQ